MQKRFDPESYEARWQAFWRERDLYRCDVPPADSRPTFCIMIPPPNVTGKLHMGHALQSSLQDLLVRWQRMRGKNALWLPGTDHAGIATQLMVERELEAEGSSRQEIGREAFTERLWQWKARYHTNIREQLERLGASCDFSRERFTLDEGLSRAVTEAFVRLYDEGLIYRGEYIVNWSPLLGTAVSDLEVESREVDGKLYHIAYPLEGSDRTLVVATTRPETMLGDTAVAVHSTDERYADLVGRRCVLPLVGRSIPVVADDHVDPEFGTGAVKITPAHDPNDFELAKRHDLEGLQVIGFDARMTAAAGADYEGLDRYEARRLVVERLEAAGALLSVEPHRHTVGHSQRSGEPVEPMVSQQWFCDVRPMAEQALRAVRDGRLRLVPESWVKTWEHWLENIRPWCISRQLWWGHRIPAWTTKQGELIVARDADEAARRAGIDDPDELAQDPDVLDTWFSSGLWPMSTLGWPDESDPDYRAFYPTDVLITGFDILFFWVARMVMMGLHFTGETPFHTVHLTGLVRDPEGEKMSKTKGNVLDPNELVDEYGADAVRFTLCALDAPGRDIPLNPEVMAGYRAFGNKIWNATRFALGRIEGVRVPSSPPRTDDLEPPERWILSRLAAVTARVDEKFGVYRFDEACQSLYRFFWGELCDWYIELAKPALFGEAERPLVAETLLYVLDQSLRLLHPVMPHLTEELWHRLPGTDGFGESISLAAYPDPAATGPLRDEALEQRFEALQALVTRVRALRKEKDLGRSVEIALWLEGEAADELVELEPLVRVLTAVETVRRGRGPESGLRDRLGALDIVFDFEEPPMAAAERRRLADELEEIERGLDGVRARLANPQFVEKAPERVVEGARRQLETLEARGTAIRERLSAEDARAAERSG